MNEPFDSPQDGMVRGHEFPQVCGHRGHVVRHEGLQVEDRGREAHHLLGRRHRPIPVSLTWHWNLVGGPLAHWAGVYQGQGTAAVGQPSNHLIEDGVRFQQ